MRFIAPQRKRAHNAGSWSGVRANRGRSRAATVIGQIALCAALAAAGLAAEKPAPVRVPIQLSSNLAILDVRVDQSAPLHFVLDTGASGSVLDAGRARELGLRLTPAGAVSTTGGTLEAESAEGVHLHVGTLEIGGVTLTALPLDRLSSGLGRRVDGILGYEVFERYVVEIDPTARTVAFHAPAAFTAPASARSVPISIEDGTPFVITRLVAKGKVVRGKLQLDTGATGALTLTSSFVAAQGLRARVGRTLAITSGALLASTSEIARLDRLELGPFRVERPLASLSLDTSGDAASSDYAGWVGAEILRRFTVAFDYGRGRAWLTPNAALREPVAFDASGLSLAGRGSAFDVVTVRSVVAGSPAARAGLREGDVITRLDGKTTTLEEARGLLRRPGREHVLAIARAGASLRVALRTRTLI
jgi:predicted aspartyl protease